MPTEPTQPGPARSARGLSRRALLVGGAGLLVAGGAGAFGLIETGGLPGKYALARLTGACGSGPPRPQGPPPARHELAFFSRYRHRTVTMVTLSPPGTADGPLGVVIGLHGSGSNAEDFARQLAPAMTAAAVRAFACVTVDGGDTYWHPRANGDDPVGMICYEVLPRLAAAGLRTARVGIVGESMGGYGALLLAERLSAQPRSMASRPAEPGLPAVTAVAALSPAIFGSYAAAAAANRSAFDNPADFARNNVLTRAAALRTVPVWVSCGSADPFAPEVTRLRARLAGVTGQAVPGGILAGCHDDAFWNRNLPAALRFLGAHRSAAVS